jgi:hypothetical protein
MADLQQQKLQRKAEELHDLEERLRSYHREEIKNHWRIGSLLGQIKDRKLYYYKDTDGTYTWELWAREFYGSRRTAERYIDLYHIFIQYYKYKTSELEDIHYSRLALAVPLLKGGDVKDRKKVDELVGMARSAPSDSEFKKMLRVRDMPLSDLQECTHIIEFWAICKVCQSRHRIPKVEINKAEEIEKKF